MKQFFPGSLMRILLPVCILLAAGYAGMLAGAGIASLCGREQPDPAMCAGLGAAFSAMPLVRLRQVWYKSLSRPGKDGRVWTVAALPAGMAASWFLGQLMTMLRLDEIFSNQAQEELLSSGIFWQVAALCLLVPAVEELVFRDLILTELDRLCPQWTAAILCAVLFALYHQNPIQGLYAFPMGLLLVLFRRKGGSLAAPVLFHAGANLLSVIMTRVG